MIFASILGFITNTLGTYYYVIRHTAAQLGVFFFLMVCEWTLIRFRESPMKIGKKQPRWSDFADNEDEDEYSSGAQSIPYIVK